MRPRFCPAIIARGMLDTEKDSAHVDGHQPVPIAHVEGFDRADQVADSGIVDHDVEAAEGSAGEGDERLNFGLDRDVCLLSDRDAIAAGGDRLDELRQVVSGLIAHHHRCSRLGKALRDGGAEPARRPAPVTIATLPLRSSAMSGSCAGVTDGSSGGIIWWHRRKNSGRRACGFLRRGIRAARSGWAHSGERSRRDRSRHGRTLPPGSSHNSRP